MEDKKIVAMYWQRDQQAIAETKNKYGRYCYAIAYRVLHSDRDAAECENDTYLNAWNSIPPHKPETLAAFLGVITRRLSLDKWRAMRAAKRGGGDFEMSMEELEECVPDGLAIQQQLEAKELARALSDFLLQQPKTECNVFLRRYWYFDAIGEIARRYGFSHSKVKMMLLRTRKKLTDFLAQEGYVDEIG